MTISQKIRQIRLDKKMTLKQTAKLLEVPTSTYRDWEYGRKIPADMVPKLAQVLGLPLTMFALKPRGVQGDLFKAISLLEEVMQIVRSAL